MEEEELMEQSIEQQDPGYLKNAKLLEVAKLEKPYQLRHIIYLQK